jgi:hypothetical protein
MVQQIHLVVHGKEDDFGRQLSLSDLDSNSEAVHFGHVKIEKRDLRPEFLDLSQTGFPVPGFGGYLHIRLCFNDVAQALANNRVIVGNYDSDFIVHALAL